MDITRNASEQCFEALVDGHRCVLEYQLQGRFMRIDHVRVPPPLEGRGLAGQLTRHALDFARSEDLQVVPRCPYVVRWLERHPEYRSLVQG